MVCTAERPRAQRKVEEGTKRRYSACKILCERSTESFGVPGKTAERRAQKGMGMMGGQKIDPTSALTLLPTRRLEMRCRQGQRSSQAELIFRGK